MVVVAEIPHLKIYIPQPIGAAAGFSAEPESLVFVYISTGCVVPTWRHQCLTQAVLCLPPSTHQDGKAAPDFVGQADLSPRRGEDVEAVGGRRGRAQPAY